MDFPVEYFRPEVRDGFYVNGMVKRVWAEQLKVLKVFDKVCRDNNLLWCAHGGTLLGAIRHKGYIPWDDDIDVIMLRDDYNKFKSIMYTSFPEGYECITYDAQGEKETNYDILTRIINNKDATVRPDYLAENCQCPYPVGVDIFPVDYIPDDPEECEVFRQICQMIYQTAKLQEELDMGYTPELAELLESIEKMTGFKYNHDVSLRYQTFQLMEAVFGSYSREECSRVAMIAFWCEERAHLYQKDWFLNPQQVPFENTVINVCADPDGELKQEYGPNYMVQDRNFPAHDYPFFEKLEKGVIDVFGFDPFNYHVDDKGIDAMQKQTENTMPKSVYFIVPFSSDWKYMEFYYDIMVSQGVQIKVIPIPFYDCDLLKNPVQENFEYDSFPQELPLADFRTVDIENDHPDEIVISFPFDQYNYSVMIDQKYFADTLKNQTDKLVYISPIETDDTQAMSPRDQTSMKHYVTVPGVVLADEVYVQSEAMKQAYIARLVSTFKEECEKNADLNEKLDAQKVNEIFSKKIKIRG